MPTLEQLQEAAAFFGVDETTVSQITDAKIMHSKGSHIYRRDMTALFDGAGIQTHTKLRGSVGHFFVYTTEEEAVITVDNSEELLIDGLFEQEQGV